MVVLNQQALFSVAAMSVPQPGENLGSQELPWKPWEPGLHLQGDTAGKVTWGMPCVILYREQLQRKGGRALEQAAQRSERVTIPGSVPKICGCDTWGLGLVVNSVVMGWWLDMILKIFSNLNNSDPEVLQQFLWQRSCCTSASNSWRTQFPLAESSLPFPLCHLEHTEGILHWLPHSHQASSDQGCSAPWTCVWRSWSCTSERAMNQRSLNHSGAATFSPFPGSEHFLLPIWFSVCIAGKLHTQLCLFGNTVCNLWFSVMAVWLLEPRVSWQRDCLKKIKSIGGKKINSNNKSLFTWK